MNCRELYNIVILCLLSLFCASCAAQNFVQNNKTYYVTSVISHNVKVGDNCTLVFQNNGKFRNCTVTAHNLRIVPNGDKVAFENVTLNGNVIQSNLAATNFGAISDMRSVSKYWAYKGIKMNIRERQGTDNDAMWKTVASFLSNSSHVKFNINGNFYSATSSSMSICAASNLEIYGGVLIKGIDLVDCSDVLVHDVSLVGFHEVHDFPAIYTTDKVKSEGYMLNGKKYTTDNAFNIHTDKLKPCGIAGNAVRAYCKTEGKKCQNITIRNCHAEMRQDGFFAGQRSRNLVTRNFNVSNCTVSHVFYQPVSAYCEYATFDSIYADYCLQPIDFSTCANHCTVKNSRFLNCYKGPKQTGAVGFKDMSHNNLITDCYFQINNKCLFIDSSCFLLESSEGKDGDTFTVVNSTFEVTKNTKLNGIVAMSSRTLLKNVKFLLSLELPKGEKYTMSSFIKSASSTLSPIVELDNVNVTVNGMGKIYTLGQKGTSKEGKDGFKVILNHCKFEGNSDVYCAFSSFKTLQAHDCQFNLNSTYFVQDINVVSLSDLFVKRISSICINGSKLASFDCNILNCQFNTDGDFIWLKNTSSSVTCKNSSINCKSFAVMKEGINNRGFEAKGNNILIKGNVAFSGLNNSHRNVFTKNNFSVQNNQFTALSSATILPSDASAAFSRMVTNNSKGARVR